MPKLELTKFSADFMVRLADWKMGGDRTVTVSLDRDSEGWKVWIYDFDRKNGIFLSADTIDGDWDKLLIDEQRNRLLEEWAALGEHSTGVA
jgi:hypothetical protein